MGLRPDRAPRTSHHSRLTPARALGFLAYPREVHYRGPPGTASHLENLAGRLGGRRLLGAWFFGDE
jgi:hypothetical protein